MLKDLNATSSFEAHYITTDVSIRSICISDERIKSRIDITEGRFNQVLNNIALCGKLSIRTTLTASQMCVYKDNKRHIKRTFYNWITTIYLY